VVDKNIQNFTMILPCTLFMHP